MKSRMMVRAILAALTLAVVFQAYERIAAKSRPPVVPAEACVVPTDHTDKGQAERRLQDFLEAQAKGKK